MSGRTSFFRLFTGFFLIATGVHASCPLELNPPSVVIKYGDPVSVNCSITGDEFGEMGWEANVGGTSLQPVSHLTWTVKNLTEWNIALQCFFTPFSNSKLKQCSSKPKVVLYQFPENIFINSTAGPSGIMTMETYNITCAVYNVAPVQNLTIKLYKGDKILANSTSYNDTIGPANHSLDFLFTPTRRDNNVKFHCEASLDLGPEGPQLFAVSEDYIITVHYGPEVHCLSGLREGETLDGHCTVTGYPSPVVSWQKDGQPIVPAMIMSRDDTGTYTVEAVGASRVKKTIPILVMYGPELKCPSSYTAVEYTAYNRTCIVKGNPEPKTIWYKDGEEVELPENLTRQDAGQYLVTASNILSSVNLTVDINVIYPPSQIKELEDSEVDVGSILWLKCSSMGNPRPKYFWNYYQTDNVKEENEDGVSFLVIQNATAYNMGSYICYAWNDRGNVSKTVRVTVKGAMQECPLQIIPDRMVIEYKSSSQNATCQSTTSGAGNKEGNIHWQDRKGIKTGGAHWFIRTDEDWDSRPFCTATFRGIGECQKQLDVTLYKTPDSVSILHVNNLTSVVEEREFQLRCDITNVAPARNLTVLWYHGNEILEPHVRGPLKVTGCQSENNTACNISVVQTPLNVSSTISITLRKHHNRAGFRCEARLDLGPEGPQPPPAMMSNRLNLTIYYKPIINTTKLQKIIPVFRGYPEELVCEADGHPPPKIQWVSSPNKMPHVSGTTLVVSEAGFYNCSATNDIDSASFEVEVILKEDYLPLIAGFVALTVVIISVIFLFIYSIYYKNTKMRRYSLKNPKLSTHNGNVAHNGLDVQLPMTKLF